MKFIITEDRLQKIIMKYLDNQDFKMIRKVFYPVGTVKSSNIFFVNSTDDSRAIIRYDVWSGTLYISDNLINEISSLFSMEYDDASYEIFSWVEEKLNKDIDIGKVHEINPDSIIGDSVLDVNYTSR